VTLLTTGSSQAYSSGWEQIFGGKKSPSKKKAKPQPASAKKKSQRKKK